MRRIVQPSRVLFVEQNRGRSACFLALALLAALMAHTAWERREADSTALGFTGTWIAGAGGFAVGAAVLLVRQRAFVVDQAGLSLHVLESGLGGVRRRSIPLKDVEVRLERTRVSLRGLLEKTTGRLSLTTEEGSIRFLDDIRGQEAVTLAHRLGADLGCRVRVCDLNEWT